MMTQFFYRGLLRYLAIIILSLTLISCTEEDPLTTDPDPVQSKEKSDQATTLLENEMYTMIHNNYSSLSELDQVNLTTANAIFKEALVLDATNAQAQFGAALTEFMLVYKDPDFNALIKDIDSAFNEGNGLNKMLSPALLPNGTAGMRIPVAEAGFTVFSMMKLAVKDPPLISRVQDVFKNKLLPRIEYAVAQFDKLEQNTAFKFTISGKMQGDPSMEPVAIYPAEVYVMDAMMHWVKFSIDAFLIYKFDIPNYDQSTLVSALNQNSTNFFVLATDGAARASTAKNDLNMIAAKLLSGITSLETLSGSKPDAVIKIGTDGIKQNDLDTTKKYLNKFKDAITQNVSVDLEDADSEGNNYTIQINLGNFFNNPPQNPKAAFFPAYTVEPEGTDGINFRFNADTYDEFNFPDPTFAGLLPGMSNATLKRIFYIDEAFAYKLSGYVQVPGGGWFNGVQLKVSTATSDYFVDLQPYEDFELFIRNATSTPVQIVRYAILIGSTEIEMQMINQMDVFYVQAKERDWLHVNLPVIPHSLSGFAMGTNSIRIEWQSLPQMQWGLYNIYKKTGSSTFELNSSGFFSNNFEDYNINQGTTYVYKVSNRIDTEYWGYPVITAKQEYFSNEVTVTP